MGNGLWRRRPINNLESKGVDAPLQKEWDGGEAHITAQPSGETTEMQPRRPHYSVLPTILLVASHCPTQTPAINSNANNQNAGSLKGWHYCWSHGINMTHKGANCRNPKEGHIPAATILNLQGGANTIYTPVIRTDGRGGGRGGRGRGRGDGRGRGQPIISPAVPVIE